MNRLVVKFFGGIILVTLSAAGLWWGRDQFLVNPFESQLSYEYPGYAAEDGQGNLYVIDRSQKRLTKTLPSGELAWIVVGGRRDPGAFFFADELSVDPSGGVYVLNRVPDPPGFYTVTSQVLHYRADGSFDRVVASRQYTEQERMPTLVQRGQWHSLHASSDGAWWYDSSPDGLFLYRSHRGSVTRTPVVTPLAADLLVPSATLLSNGETAYVTKQGRIIETTPGGGSRILLDASGGVSGVVPWKIQDTAGTLAFTDLGHQSVTSLLADGSTRTLYSNAGQNVYSLSLGPSGVLGTTGDEGAVLLPGGSAPLKPTGARYGLTALVLHGGLWLLLFVGLAALISMGWLIYTEIFHRVLPPFFKTAFGVVTLTALVGSFVSVLILNNFSQRYSTEVLSKISQLVHLVPKVLDVNEFLDIRQPAQFGGPEYQQLRQQLISTIYGDDGKENQGLYFALHKVNDGQLTTFMYLNGDTTIRQPFAYLNDPQGPYQQALKGQSVAQYALDAWGSWMYATGPIKDQKGSIVGVFEMGGDLYSFTQENNRLIQSLLVNILTVLVVFLLVLLEATFLRDQLRKKALEKTLREQGLSPRRNEDVFHPSYLVRPLTGLFFVTISMSLLLLPLLMKHFYHPLWGLPESVVYALPVSFRLLFFGVGTVLGGNLTRIWGWRTVFFVGLVISALGLALGAISTELTLFLIASVPVGLGAGLGMIGLRALVNAEEAGADTSSGYGHFYAGVIAGTNVGVLVGSGLADLVGASAVFWIAAAFSIASGWLVLRLFPHPSRSPQAADTLGTRQALRTFFLNPRLLRFSLLIVLPVYVASMVLYFFLPVFAESQGVSNADMGRIFLMNGLIIVYLGPSLSRVFQRRWKTRGALAATTIFWAVSLVPFLIWGTLWSLVVTIALMGIAEGTAAVAQNDYLLALPVSQAVGSDRAAGSFEVIAKIGETVAPILIGFAMIGGAQGGILLVTALLAAGLVLFAVFGGLSRPRAAA